MSEVFIQHYHTFSWEKKHYLCAFTSKKEWWVHLSPVFGRRIAALKKTYPTFTFRTYQELAGTEEKPMFLKFARTSLFLPFSQFEEVANNEQYENLVSYFREQLNFDPLTDATNYSTNSTSLPSPGYIYVIKFQPLGIGKVGITENWRKRARELKREYLCGAGQIILREITQNAKALEHDSLEWLKEKNALLAVSTSKGSASRETFSLDVISAEKVCEFVYSKLETEKKLPVVFQEIDQILVNKLQTNNGFALEYYKARDKNFLEIVVGGLSSQARERLAREYLSKNRSLPENEN